MMRRLLVIGLLFGALLLFVHVSGVEAHIVTRPLVAVDSLPDLVVKEIIFETSGRTKIRVRVLNQGTAPSSSCHLALISLVGEEQLHVTKQRVWTIEIPELQAGKGISHEINVYPLTQAQGPWKAVIDRSNTVKESNEGNNALQVAYPAAPSSEGAVKIRLPDLQITRAVLIDSTTGEVSVEVSNKGTGTAQTSTLRLIVWEMGKFEQKEAKTVFVTVPIVLPLKKVNVKAKAGVPVISTKWSLFIDIGNDVKEQNEQNNRYEGEAGKS